MRTKFTKSILQFMIIFLTISCVMISSADAGNYQLKIATLAPEGSVWLDEFQEMNEEIKKLTDNQVLFKIYPGGILGDEDVIVRKIRAGQLDGAAFISGTLCNINEYFRALAIPQVFKNQQEVDYILDKLEPKLVTTFREHGYEALGFTGIGFTYMFTKNPVTSAQSLKKSKAWIIKGDPVMKELYKAAKVTPISMGIGDVMTALQTDLLNTFFNTPSGLLAFQWFTKVDYMVDLPLTYSFGAVLIKNRSWKKLPDDLKAIVRQQVKKHMKNITVKSRQDNQRAREIISSRGVQITPPTQQLVDDFNKISATAREQLKNSYYLPESLKQIQMLQDEYNQLQSSTE